MAQKATEVLAGQLPPDQPVLAAFLGTLAGGLTRAVKAASGGTGIEGLVGDAVLSLATAGVKHERTALGEDLAGGVVVAVTPGWIVLCSTNSMSTGPKDAVARIDRGAVTGVTSGTRRIVGLVKVPTVDLTFTTEDGPQVISLEAAKVAAKDVQSVLAALGA